MRRIIISLVVRVVCLACFLIAGIGYAISDPSWRLLLYGASIGACLLMAVDDVDSLVKTIRAKDISAQESTEEEE